MMSRAEKVRWMFNKRVAPIAIIYIGLCAAPFYFTWSGLCVCAVSIFLTGIGITVGLHRLLTHRSFSTSRFMERLLALLGALAFQGGVIDWVVVHRLHHANSDSDRDPHTPKDSFWRGYVFRFSSCAFSSAI